MTVAIAGNILTSKTIAGVAGNVTAESHSNCASNGSQNCVATGSYFAGTSCASGSSACYLPTYTAGTQPLLAIDYDNIDATKMRATLTIAGKTGSLGDCSTDGATGCVAVTGFPSARLANFTAGNIQSGIAVAGVSGSLANCAADGTLGCVTVTGFPSARLANFTAANVQGGTTIAGVGGSLGNCTSDGGTSCVANASFTAAATSGLASKVLSTTTVAGIQGNVTLPAVGNVLATITYGVSGTGSTGTMTLPSAGNVLASSGTYGVGGNGTTPTLTLPTAANVRVANGSYGVGGNGTSPSLADCSGDGTLGCVTVTGFPSARLANFTAANVQSGTTIAGVTGSLSSCSTDGDTACITTASFPSARLANFTAANVQSGTTIAGVAGTIASCTSDGQTGCVSSALLPAANVSGFSTWNLRTGTTLAGLSGTLKTNCRNTVNSTYFNFDGSVGSLGTGGVTSGTAFDYWDTIDDYYGLPSSRVTAWSTDTYCDSSTWLDRTTTNGGTSFTTCGTSSTCIYQDRITNLQVTDIISGGSPYNSTNTGSPASLAWNTAVQACAASTYGGYAAGTWRLPTQKELMSLYEHGIVSMVGSNFITLANMQNNYFWSSSTLSYDTIYAWFVYLASGDTNANYNKTNSLYVVCVR
jgi:hypothetical protein